MEAYQLCLHQLPSSEVNYWKDSVCNWRTIPPLSFQTWALKYVWLNILCYMQGSSELCHIKKWSNLIIFLWYGYHEEANTIFWLYSEANEQSWSIHWILLDVFFYIQISFSIFFMDSKVNCQIHMIIDMLKNIWKEYFIKECF